MMAYLDLGDSNKVEPDKFLKIVEALMYQVERSMDGQGNSYSLFQTATLLEDKIKNRTTELQAALKTLEETNRELSRTKSEAETVKARLEEAVESISEGFVLFDRHDRLVLSNTRYQESWGKAHKNLAEDATFEEIIREIAKNKFIETANDDPESWLQERIHQHKSPHEPFVSQLTDGRWYHIDERPTSDGGSVGIYTDISDIKLEEEQRRESELAEKSMLLQATLDNLSQGVSVFDKNLQLVFWNEQFADLLKLPQKLLRQGTPYQTYMAHNTRQGEYGGGGVGTFKQRIESARQFKPLNLQYTRADGSSLEIRRNPMPGGGFVTTYTDVTASRKAAQDLTEAKVNLGHRVRDRTVELSTLNNQMRQEIKERKIIEKQLQLAKTEAEEANISKTKFLAAASHDLLQPLNAARLFSSALMERKLSGKNNELAEGINGALYSVESMLSALLDISKLDAGAVPVAVTSFQLSALLERIISEYAPIAEEAGLDFTWNCSDFIVKSDNELLGRIVRNLISNAIRYTPNGQVTIACRDLGDLIRLEVRDTGVGIAEDMFDKIFEEFQQLNNNTRKGDAGVGLGLAVVRRIANILNHEIGVESAPGKGSVFFLDIPKGIKVDRPTQTKQFHPGSNSAIKDTNIIIIDNEPSILEGLGSLLREWGCEVSAGLGIRDMLRTLKEEKHAPDIAIVDFHLSDDENGIDCIRRLRQETGKAIPGIIITADHSERVYSLVIEEGLFIINKPTPPARLRALLGHILTHSDKSIGKTEKLASVSQ